MDSSDEVDAPIDDWSKKEQAILREYLQPFRACKGSESSVKRTEICNDVYVKLQKLHPSASAKERKALRERIKAWFRRYGRTKASRDKVRLQQAYSYRSVIGFWYKEKIRKNILKEGPVGGTAEYLAMYQKTLSALIMSLPPSRIEEAHLEAKRWNARKPPVEVQAKNARLKSRKYVSQFVDQMYRQLGMYTLVLTHHKNEQGEVQYLIHDYGAEACGLSMDDACPEWQEQPVLDGLAEHATKLYDTSPTGAVKFQPKAKNRKVPEIRLTFKDGLPILPPEGLNQDLAWKKALVRTFVHAAFCFAAGERVKHAPWGGIELNQDLLIDPEYLGNDGEERAILKEPSKMRDLQVKRLVNHWYLREADPTCEETFRFKAYLTKSGEILPARNLSRWLQDMDIRQGNPADEEETTSPRKTKPLQKVKDRSKQQDVELEEEDTTEDTTEDESTAKSRATAKSKGREKKEKVGDVGEDLSQVKSSAVAKSRGRGRKKHKEENEMKPPIKSVNGADSESKERPTTKSTPQPMKTQGNDSDDSSDLEGGDIRESVETSGPKAKRKAQPKSEFPMKDGRKNDCKHSTSKLSANLTTSTDTSSKNQHPWGPKSAKDVKRPKKKPVVPESDVELGADEFWGSLDGFTSPTPEEIKPVDLPRRSDRVRQSRTNQSPNKGEPTQLSADSTKKSGSKPKPRPVIGKAHTDVRTEDEEYDIIRARTLMLENSRKATRKPRGK